MADPHIHYTHAKSYLRCTLHQCWSVHSGGRQVLCSCRSSDTLSSLFLMTVENLSMQMGCKLQGGNLKVGSFWKILLKFIIWKKNVGVHSCAETQAFEQIWKQICPFPEHQLRNDGSAKSNLKYFCTILIYYMLSNETFITHLIGKQLLGVWIYCTYFSNLKAPLTVNI